MDHESPAHREASSRKRFHLGRVLVPLFIAFIITMVLRDYIPALDNAIEQVLHPTTYKARKACSEAALAAAEQPTFARITAKGEAHETQGAYYITGIRVGEMGQSATEVFYEFSCYVDLEGKVVKTHKGLNPSKKFSELNQITPDKR